MLRFVDLGLGTLEVLRKQQLHDGPLASCKHSMHPSILLVSFEHGHSERLWMLEGLLARGALPISQVKAFRRLRRGLAILRAKPSHAADAQPPLIRET